MNICRIDDVRVPNCKMDSKKEQGGYNCEFVQKPPDYVQAECPVCKHIVREPYLTSCCGYNFCKICIERIHTDREACPTCNESAFNISTNKGVQRMLNNFTVQCSNEKQGCKWTGKLESLDNHLNVIPPKEKQLEGCEYTDVKCIYCNYMLCRKEIAGHQTDHCTKRPFGCQYCKTYKTDYYDVVNNHWLKCGYKPVPCPNKCGENPFRQHLEQHIGNDCSLALINCEFPGCEEKICRKDMPQHLQNGLVNHISLLATTCKHKLIQNEEIKVVANSIDTLQEENKALNKTLTALTEQVNTLQTKEIKISTDRVDALQIENETLKQEMRVLASHIDSLQIQNKEEIKSLSDHSSNFQSENKSLREELTSLTDRVNSLQVESKEKIKAVAEYTGALQTHGKTLSEHGEALANCVAILNQIADGVNGIEFTMTSVAVHQKECTYQSFQPFYTHFRGYKLRFESGFRLSFGTKYLEIRVYLMQGEFDGKIVWPLKGRITVLLFNKESDKELKSYQFTERRPSQQETLVNRPNTLTIKCPVPSQFVKQDCLKFRVIFSLQK